LSTIAERTFCRLLRECDKHHGTDGRKREKGEANGAKATLAVVDATRWRGYALATVDVIISVC
jgi:hypothetical protein